MRRHLRFGPTATAILLAIYIAAALPLIRIVEDAFSPFFFHVH